MEFIGFTQGIFDLDSRLFICHGICEICNSCAPSILLEDDSIKTNQDSSEKHGGNCL